MGDGGGRYGEVLRNKGWRERTVRDDEAMVWVYRRKRDDGRIGEDGVGERKKGEVESER